MTYLLRLRAALCVPGDVEGVNARKPQHRRCLHRKVGKIVLKYIQCEING